MLNTKVQSLPNSLQKAVKNNRIAASNNKSESDMGLKNRGAEGRRRMKALAEDNGSLTRSQKLAAEISS